MSLSSWQNSKIVYNGRNDKELKIVNKQDIDGLLGQASQKGTIHSIGPKPTEERSLFARLRKIGTPILLSAALLTTIAGCAPKAPDLSSSAHQATEISAPTREDFVKDQLQKEIMENGANIIVTTRFINHKASAQEYLSGNQWDGTGAGQHHKYVIGYETVNPNHPTVILSTKYAGVSKELFDALCTPIKTYEGSTRTTEKCELPSERSVTYTQDFYGGSSQLKGDYTRNTDGSFDFSSLSLRISDPSSPTEFTALSQASKDGMIEEAGPGIFIDHSVEKESGEIFNSVKLSASSLKSKIMENRMQERAPDLHMKSPRG